MENAENDEAFAAVQQEALRVGFNAQSKVVACMRVGTDEQRFIYTTLKQMATLEKEMGAPLHSLVVLGNEVSDMEQEMLNLWLWK